MKAHNDLTIFRNRHRAGELREFRALVEDYFLRAARDPDGIPVDWEGAQAVRSRIHQMLPRVIQVVRAAGLEGPAAPHPMATDPGPQLGQVDALQRIFTPRYANGGEQELLDILDMARGVYDADQMSALVRSVSPFHYTGVALTWVARVPRRLLRALGLGGVSRRPVDAEVARLEAVAARLSDIDQLVEARLATLEDRHIPRVADQARQIAELAERLDFAERMLAQGGSVARLSPPPRDAHVTPV